MHYERRNVEALGKLRVLEPQLAASENEYEKLMREVEKNERKNRALVETQSHYERKRIELKQDLQVSENLTFDAFLLNFENPEKLIHK